MGETAPRHARARIWALHLAVVAASAVAGLGIAEVALRTIVRDYSPITFDLYYRDSDGDLRLQPGARRQHTTPEWSVAIETTADGFRGAGKTPAGERRIVLGLGDSFAFGWGVETRETFLSRLERSLGGAAAGLRVVNAAVPGTGTTDQLALLRRLLDDVAPDVVLVAFYVGNDFHDVAEGGASQFDVVDGLLVRRGQGGGLWDRSRAWVKRKSYVAQMIARQVWTFERRRTAARPVTSRSHPGLDQQDAALRQFMQIHLRGALPGALATGVDATLAALGEMRRLSVSRRARFVLLAIPRNIQVYDDDRRRYETAFGIAPAEWDLERPQAILSTWAAANGVEYLDPLPALRRAAAGPMRLYYFPDSHMTAQGHGVVADVLRQHFERSPIADTRVEPAPHRER